MTQEQQYYYRKGFTEGFKEGQTEDLKLIINYEKYKTTIPVYYLKNGSIEKEYIKIAK